MYRSETDKARPYLVKYAIGNGIDVGAGGDPIVPEAITIDKRRENLNCGNHPINLVGNGAHLYWFANESLDYVYSSHLLEDFPPNQTELVLMDWLRVLRIGGLLILNCPVEQIYRKHCEDTGQPYNPAHQTLEMSGTYILNILLKISCYEIVYFEPLINIYSFYLVVRKIR